MALQSVLQDPSLEAPKMAFNNGQVSNGAAVIDSALPTVAGPESSWQVTEWSKTNYLQPNQMTTNNPAFADPLYGAPLDSWQSSDGLTELGVYSASGQTTGGPPYVYDLQSSESRSEPGSDLFLSSNPTSLIPMDNPLIYSLDMKISEASASYLAPENSSGLAQVFTGLAMVYNAPGSANYNPALKPISALMQIAMANSDGTGAAGTANQYINVATDGSITYQYNAPGDPSLPFQATAGQPTALTYDVNKYLDAMIADDPGLPSAATNLSNWSFEGLYVGEEIASSGVPISVGIQISNLNLQTDPAQTVSYQPPVAAVPVAPPPPPAPKTLFTMTDQTQNNTSTLVTASSYNGPLSFLTHSDAYSYNGSDNVTISAQQASNPLLASGSGDDTLTGSSTGHSTLDAGTGINFDVDGGSKSNTFVQNDYVAGNTWDFVKNFAGGDEDIFFGYTPGLSKISLTESGLGSYKGATVTIQPGNGNTDAATFVGVSASALHGTFANIDGVPSWVVWS